MYEEKKENRYGSVVKGTFNLKFYGRLSRSRNVTKNNLWKTNQNREKNTGRAGGQSWLVSLPLSLSIYIIRYFVGFVEILYREDKRLLLHHIAVRPISNSWWWRPLIFADVLFYIWIYNFLSFCFLSYTLLSSFTFLRVLSVCAVYSSWCERKSSMAEESETKKVFDAEAAASVMKELRGSYGSGRTRSYEWRVAQLKNMMKIVDDHERDILDAIRYDLCKPDQEAYIAEVWVLCLFELIIHRISIYCSGWLILFYLLNFPLFQ